MAAAIVVPTVKRPIARAKVRRVASRRMSEPVIGMTTAIVSMKAVDDRT